MNKSKQYQEKNALEFIFLAFSVILDHLIRAYSNNFLSMTRKRIQKNEGFIYDIITWLSQKSTIAARDMQLISRNLSREMEYFYIFCGLGCQQSPRH